MGPWATIGTRRPRQRFDPYDTMFETTPTRVTVLTRGFAALLCALAVSGCAAIQTGQSGLRDGRLMPCPTRPNCIASADAEADASHRIEPFRMRVPSSEAWTALRVAVDADARTELVERWPNYIRAEARSLLGFVDDLEFLLDRRANLIHIRAAARVGYSDLGVNRRRINAIREALRRAGVIE